MENNEDKKKVIGLRWEVYIKEEEEFIKRVFSVVFLHLKGGGG